MLGIWAVLVRGGLTRLLISSSQVTDTSSQLDLLISVLYHHRGESDTSEVDQDEGSLDRRQVRWK